MNTIAKYKENYVIEPNGEVISKKLGRALKPGLAGAGYPVVNLSINGKATLHYIHRLVATVHVPNPDKKSDINHLNG